MTPKLLLAGAAAASIASLFSFNVALAQASPAPFVTGHRFDLAGRETGTIHPDPDGAGPLGYQASRTTYAANGQISKIEKGNLSTWQSDAVDPQSWAGFTIQSTTEYEYDSWGRKTKQTTRGQDGAAVSVVQYSYDAAEHVLCEAQRMNPSVFGSLPADACTLGTAGTYGPDRIARYSYDSRDFVISEESAVGTSIATSRQFERNGTGQILKFTDERGYSAAMEYDGLGRQVKWSFPSKTAPGTVNTGDFEQYTYDVNGNRLTSRKRDGQVISYDYDNLNRMVHKGGPAVADVNYTYDLRGLQLSATFLTSGLGVVYTYDGFGRLLSETQNNDGVSRTVSSQYDLNGNRTRVTHPDGQYFQFDYDGVNRPTNVKQATTVMGSIGYNSRGLPSQVAWNYAAASANAQSFGYDLVGRLNSIALDLNGASNDVSWTYTRNPADQITSETQSNDSYSWNGYVNLSRTYASNGLNQYTTAGSANFTYDAKGNLTSDGTYTFTYDIENRLVSRSGGGQSITLSYDPTGRLYQITGGTLGTQRFVYDGNALIGEYNGAGTLLRRYVHGSNLDADDPLIVYEGSAVTYAERRYLHVDPRGSIVAVTNYQGTSLYTNAYDEYGIPDAASGNDIATKGRFRYTGQAWIPELGMYYYKARMYSPTLGRFLQTDPIGYEDQYNLYAYVANDPLNKTDFSGECPMCIIPMIPEIIEGAGFLATALEGTGVVEGAVSAVSAARTFAVGAATVKVATSEARVASTASEAASSGVYRGSTLARNMANAGNPVAKGTQQAHHLVAQNASAAAPARGVLKRVGIGIHDASNGAAVNNAIHAGAHTARYYDRVNQTIQAAEKGGKAAVESALKHIRSWFD